MNRHLAEAHTGGRAGDANDGIGERVELNAADILQHCCPARVAHGHVGGCSGGAVGSTGGGHAEIAHPGAAQVLVESEQAGIDNLHARQAGRGALRAGRVINKLRQLIHAAIAHAVSRLHQGWRVSIGIPHRRIGGTQKLPAARGNARVHRGKLTRDTYGTGRHRGTGTGAAWHSTRLGGVRRRTVGKARGKATECRSPLGRGMPVNERFARKPQQVCGLVHILAVIEHIDFYRARFRSRRGGRGEILQEFGRIARRIRRFKRQQQGGGGRDAVHLIL